MIDSMLSLSNSVDHCRFRPLAPMVPSKMIWVRAVQLSKLFFHTADGCAVIFFTLCSAVQLRKTEFSKVAVPFGTHKSVSTSVKLLQYANALYKAGGCSDAYKRITDDWLVTNEKRRAGELPAQDIVHIRFFSIGPVMITGFSAEMTSELSMILSLNAFPDHIIFSMGNLFDTRRYIASTALVEKGAYEGLTSTFAYNTTPIVKGEGERLMLTASKRAKEIMA